MWPIPAIIAFRFLTRGQISPAYGHAGSGWAKSAIRTIYKWTLCGLQYVCEFGNSRIQILDSQDKTLEILGEPGGGPGQFSNPWSIELDSKGNLYVADALNNRVQKFIRKP